MQNKRSKFAFTLAEVLIAVAIIGVVAALTLPNLYRKTQERTLRANAQRAYSNIVQAARLLYAESPELFDCYYEISHYWRHDSICKDFWTEYSKKLKVSKTCPNNAYQKKCIPNYKYNNPPNESYGFQMAPLKTFPRAFVLVDGTIILPYYNSFEHPIIIVDTNGKKGPNKPGYDLFSLQLKQNGPGEFPIITGKNSSLLNANKNNGGKPFEDWLK